MAAQLTVRQNASATFEDPVGVRSEFVLKVITDRLSDRYDYIIIDCGRSLDLLTINALAASSEVIIPVQAHYLPEEGLGSFLETVRKIRMNLNPSLEVGGILLTMYQGSTNLCRSVQQDIRSRFGETYRVFQQPISHSIRVAEAPAFKKSIFEHDPSNPAAQGYREMAREVLGHAQS
jgi:chromosome partitioning protein